MAASVAVFHALMGAMMTSPLQAATSQATCSGCLTSAIRDPLANKCSKSGVKAAEKVLKAQLPESFINTFMKYMEGSTFDELLNVAGDDIKAGTADAAKTSCEQCFNHVMDELENNKCGGWSLCPVGGPIISLAVSQLRSSLSPSDLCGGAVDYLVGLVAPPATGASTGGTISATTGGTTGAITGTTGASANTPSQPSPPLKTYIIGTTAMNTCPSDSFPILSASDCESAAGSLGLAWKTEESDENFPKGCSKYEEEDGSYGVYYNTHVTGSGDAYSAPICGIPAPPAPTGASTGGTLSATTGGTTGAITVTTGGTTGTTGGTSDVISKGNTAIAPIMTISLVACFFAMS